jgi:hypothetical protein
MHVWKCTIHSYLHIIRIYEQLLYEYYCTTE